MGTPTAALDHVLQRFTVFAAAFTTTLCIGIAQLLGTMLSFWRIRRRWGTIDQESGQVVIENNTGVVASAARTSQTTPS
ncbi:hypothetical protein FA13DRAFT_1126232 [Coprinellus micaceus]|uniref:Uncharacterized protein n=1 Tax=Coprinellus micaceus TaxID=71717 RepID=A0A4Y7SWL4_COPMI|nr:hypothetical protein FA13DRAFT_1126232 [Coprinellus micaceus]